MCRLSRPSLDFGPGNKLLGALEAHPTDCYLVLADDDVRYRRDFLSGLIEAQHQNHSASFSYYTYRAHGLTIGQGCDGISCWSPNLAGMATYAHRYVLNTDVFYVDDLWICFYLASRGVRVKSRSHLLKGRLIYEHVLDEATSLKYLTGAA